MPAAGIRPRPAQDSRPTREPAWAHGPSSARARPCSASRPVRGRLPMWTQAGQTATMARPMSATAQESGGQAAAVKQALPLRIARHPAIAVLPAAAVAKVMAAPARVAEPRAQVGHRARMAARPKTQTLSMGQAPTARSISQLAAPRAVAVPAPAFRSRCRLVANLWPACARGRPSSPPALANSGGG